MHSFNIDSKINIRLVCPICVRFFLIVGFSPSLLWNIRSLLQSMKSLHTWHFHTCAGELVFPHLQMYI